MSEPQKTAQASAEQELTFQQALGRLEEIVTEVRKKDVDLDRSLDLLEEGVRLANTCTDRIDHTRMLAEETQDGGEREVHVGEGDLS